MIRWIAILVVVAFMAIVVVLMWQAADQRAEGEEPIARWYVTIGSEWYRLDIEPGTCVTFSPGHTKMEVELEGPIDQTDYIDLRAKSGLPTSVRFTSYHYESKRCQDVFSGQ